MFKKRDSRAKSSLNSSIFKDKKAQVTIFIILGIVLLLVVVLVILLTTEAVTFKPGELIPTKKGKVEKFITSCISEVGENALFLIGLHGGYLNVSPEIKSDSTQHLKLSPNEVVPLWARGEIKRIPPLVDIKKRIDQKIEKDLKSCLIGRKAFNKSYILVEKSSPKANTEIVDKKVIFNVKWNLEVKDKAGEVIAEVDDHVAESSIKLKRTYETAKAIIERELIEKKFEDLTIDLLSLDHPKVPLTGIDFSCSKKQWKANEVKDNLKDLLRINLGQVKIKGTEYVEFPSTLPYYQNHYMWDVGVDYSDITVNFNFNNNFPFAFDVTPRDGNTLKSGMTGGNHKYLSYVCLQLWKFTYSVDYPVLVQVLDDQDFVFNTGFTVHVKRNRADRSGGFLIPSSPIIDIPLAEKYCSKREIPIKVNTYSLIENNETGVYWRDPLGKVNLSYTCLKYTCDVGETEYGFGGLQTAGYKTNFPYCSGGILRGKREGYKSTWKRVVANKEQTVELDLLPLSNFPVKNINVVKYSLVNGQIKGKAQPLEKGESVSVKIKRDKEVWGPYESTAVISPDIDDNLLKQTTLDFLGQADYQYQLEIYLIDNKGINGGYKNNWTVDWNELQSGTNLTFAVLTDSFKSETKLFDFMGNLDNYSKVNQKILEPQFK